MTTARHHLGLAVALLAAATLTSPAQQEGGAAAGPFAGGARRPDRAWGAGGGEPATGERARPLADALRGSEAGREMMLMRLLSSPRVSEELGISAAQSDALRAGLMKLQEREIDLQAQVQKLALRQAEVVSGLLAKRDRTPDEALRLVEEMGALRTQIAKLPVERIVLVRENLTDEQVLKARELARTRLEQFRAEGERRGRREEGEGREEGERRGRRAEGEARGDGERRGHRDGEAPPPPAEAPADAPAAPDAARF